MATTMSHIMNNSGNEKFSLAQQCSLDQGLKIFGSKGEDAALKEVRQQHTRKGFSTMAVAALSDQECRRAQQASMHSAQKSGGTIEGQMGCNGKPT